MQDAVTATLESMPCPQRRSPRDANDGQFDAVVTMHYDQGQIAIKLMRCSAA